MIFKILSSNKVRAVILSVSFIACTNPPKKEKDILIEKKQYLSEKNEVETIILQKGSFKEEIVSNGKLKAIEKSTLSFKTSGGLEKLHVTEGDYVSKNKTLAQLNADNYKQSLKSAEISLKKKLLRAPRYINK